MLDGLAKTGLAKVEAKTEPDRYDDLERKALHKRYDAETKTITEGNRDRRINRKLRTTYADRVFCYLTAYSVFVAAILIASGWRLGGFSLPNEVLSFLVGSTAAAAIGLVGFVVSGLFKNLR